MECAIIRGMSDTAILSSKGKYTLFTFNGNQVRFRTSARLVRYTRVKTWDDGYLEVGADYGNGEVEEYIDLDSILRELYLDPREYLSGITKVEVRYV